jgi:hypothetical protein
VNLPYWRQYVIRELRDVSVLRTGGETLPIVMTAVAVVLWVGLAVIAPLLQTPGQWLAALVVVIAPSIVGGACWRFRRPEYELRATYRGNSIKLLRTTDTQTFGQVKRALVRAMEADRYR